MNSILAPAELFSAYALASDGSDPDLAKGTHLRVYAGLGASFPLPPFTIFRVASLSADVRNFVLDQSGARVPDANLAARGPLQIVAVLGDSATRHTVRLDLGPRNGDLAEAQLLDQHERVVATRHAGPWSFASPRIHSVRVRGSADGVQLASRRVDPQAFATARNDQDIATLGFPVSGSRPWYAGGTDRAEALRRVLRGAPRRLTAPDRPDGPLSSLQPEDEAVRVEALLAYSRMLDGGWEKLLQQMLDDERKAPWHQAEPWPLPAGPGHATLASSLRLPELQLAATDPGLARFFGFAEQFDTLPDFESDGGWDTLAVVGLFAFDPEAWAAQGLHLGSPGRDSAAGAPELLAKHLEALQRTGGQEVRDPVDRTIRTARAQGLMVAPFVTFAAAVPPGPAPKLPPPEIVERRWISSDGLEPGNAYSASFAFPGMPLSVLSSLGRRAPDGTWKTRHDLLDVGPRRPATRAMPALFGHEAEPMTRQRIAQAAVVPLQTTGLLADREIPAAGATRFRAAAADAFGRFGLSVEFEVTPPDRPEPPAPVLRFTFVAATTSADPALPASPGAVRITIAVPRPTGPAFSPAETEQTTLAVRVPRLDELAAGSLNLHSLELRLGALAPLLVEVTDPGFITRELLLPELLPQTAGTWDLTAVFIDRDGRRSVAATAEVKARDPRPPALVPTGVGLFWTAEPGPAPDVELALRWPAAPGSQFRVYLTDAAGLGLTAPVPGTPAPGRAAIAATGCDAMRDHHPVPPGAFRLLTDPPLLAGAERTAVLRTLLPRTLEPVQFLRIVPLGPTGNEAPFEHCGVVPVAVPTDRRPAPPRLFGQIEPQSGKARLLVTADGFDLTELRRDEPGLFGTAEGRAAPRCRLRRAVATVSDPLYARVIHEKPLAVPAETGAAWSADIVDPENSALEPFVRYTYWAEVEMPPERRVPAGVTALKPEGGVEPLDPAGGRDHPRPPSLPSAPVVLMHLPDQVPAAPPPASLRVTTRAVDEAGRAVVGIEFTGAPRAHARAVDRYRLALWGQWPGHDLASAVGSDGTPLQSWPVIESGATSVVLTPPSGANPVGSITLRVALVDPAGRVGALTSLQHPGI